MEISFTFICILVRKIIPIVHKLLDISQRLEGGKGESDRIEFQISRGNKVSEIFHRKLAKKVNKDRNNLAY